MAVALDFCTIVSKNYLAYARALGESIRAHHPESRYFVCLVDRVDDCFDPAAERFTTILAEDLGIEDFPRFAFSYSVIEINTAVKPWFLAKLMHEHGATRLVYLDPDILVFDRLAPVEQALEWSSVVLTPHLTTPYSDKKLPGEIEILRAGTFNLGFIALASGPTADALLKWWCERLYEGCIMDPDKGFHVDQKWIDLVPGFFDDVHIARDPGLNAAYWNLHERRDGDFPLYFFHFSGFDPRHPDKVSRHQNRYEMADIGETAKLYALYRERLIAHGYEATRDLPYAYANFDNGEVIPADLRRGYLTMGDAARPQGNPFSAEGGLFPWWHAQRENYASQAAVSVRATMSKGIPIDRVGLGVNIVGYFRAETGVGETARAISRSLQTRQIPVALNVVWDHHAPNACQEVESFSDSSPHPTNLLHINADSVANFAEANPELLKGRRNVGYWSWEQSTFPARWRGTFDYFDAIWTISKFVAEPMAKVSSVPVRVVSSPVVPSPDLALTRAELGLPEDRFLFMYAFDFHSYFERKNPLGAIRAFRRAFGDDPRVMLVVKAARGEGFPEEAERLRDVCRGLPNVRLIETVWTRARTHGLLNLCDAYLSLHRMEGFGFLLAEAMALGKPVIATGYSGNLEFMNAHNSLLVRYEPAEIPVDCGPYRKGTEWAEPDLDHAAEQLLRLVGDTTLAKRLGVRGARYIAENYSYDAVGQRAEAELRRIIAQD